MKCVIDHVCYLLSLFAGPMVYLCRTYVGQLRVRNGGRGVRASREPVVVYCSCVERGDGAGCVLGVIYLRVSCGSHACGMPAACLEPACAGGRPVAGMGGLAGELRRAQPLVLGRCVRIG